MEQVDHIDLDHALASPRRLHPKMFACLQQVDRQMIVSQLFARELQWLVSQLDPLDSDELGSRGKCELAGDRVFL